MSSFTNSIFSLPLSFIEGVGSRVVAVGEGLMDAIVNRSLYPGIRLDFVGMVGKDPSVLIFARLDLADLRSVARVCKAWNSLINKKKMFQRSLTLGCYRDSIQAHLKECPTSQDDLLRDYVQVMVSHNLEEAKTIAGQISPAYGRQTLAYLAIARVDPSYVERAKASAEQILVHSGYDLLKIAKVDPSYIEWATTTAAREAERREDPTSRARYYTRIAELDPTYLAQAKAAAGQIEYLGHRDEAYLRIIKLEVKHNLTQAKETAELISSSPTKALAYIKIAKVDPSYISRAQTMIEQGVAKGVWVRIPFLMKLGKLVPSCLSQVKEMADQAETESNWDDEFKYKAYTKMVKVFPEYLRKAKAASLQIGADFFQDKQLKKIAKLEAQDNPYEARKMVGLIQSSYSRSEALGAILA
jgi:hypothetical protein